MTTVPARRHRPPTRWTRRSPRCVKGSAASTPSCSVPATGSSSTQQSGTARHLRPARRGQPARAQQRARRGRSGASCDQGRGHLVGIASVAGYRGLAGVGGLRRHQGRPAQPPGGDASVFVAEGDPCHDGSARLRAHRDDVGQRVPDAVHHRGRRGRPDHRRRPRARRTRTSCSPGEWRLPWASPGSCRGGSGPRSPHGVPRRDRLAPLVPARPPDLATTPPCRRPWTRATSVLPVFVLDPRLLAPDRPRARRLLASVRALRGLPRRPPRRAGR